MANIITPKVSLTKGDYSGTIRYLAVRYRVNGGIKMVTRVRLYDGSTSEASIPAILGATHGCKPEAINVIRVYPLGVQHRTGVRYTSAP